MATDDLTCQELVELVTDYLEGAMTAADRARFEAHLSQCAGCRNYLNQMRRTLGAVGALTEESIPLSEQERLLALFRGWKQRQGE